MDPYQQASGAALSLAPGHLADCATNDICRLPVAALRGSKHLAHVLKDLDAISGACERCGNLVRPDEPQRVLPHEQQAR